MQFFKNTKYNFLRHSKTAIGLAVAFILVSAVMLIVNDGFRLSIDFAGGTTVLMKFDEPVIDKLPDIRNAVTALGFGTPEIKTIGNIRAAARADGDAARTDMNTDADTDVANDDAIRAADVTDADSAAVAVVDTVTAVEDSADGAAAEEVDITPAAATVDMSDIMPTAAAAVTDSERPSGASGNNVIQITVRNPPENIGVSRMIQESVSAALPGNRIEILGEDNVGPKIGRELTRDAVWVSLLALLVILSYVGLRFKLSYAVASVIPLGINVLIILGIFAMFKMELTLPFLAAVLTVIGYALNDTIVVFDRVRENLKNGLRGKLFDDVVNTSINQTLSRTIVTSVTTLFTVGALYILGSESIKDFALALGVGIVVGTLSTMYIASFILTLWHKKWAIVK